MSKLVITEKGLAAAFTEWERRWREEPDRFMKDSERLSGTSETYGEAAAPYLLQILSEQAGVDAGARVVK